MSMTDSRPEITAKADDSKVILQFRHKGIHFSGADIALSPQECFALQCQLSAAFQAVAEHQHEQGTAALSIDTEGRLEATVLPAEGWSGCFGVATDEQVQAMADRMSGKGKPKTWRDRESMF